ncbi:MAG TPA: DUF2207 domain-containing protein [Candidatus Dormibacteraeota bacterium]
MRSRTVLSLLAALWLTVMAAGSVHADEGWVIKSFQSTITIRQDSTIAVVEDIRVDFGGLQKHGIFRTIPIRYRYNDSNDRVYDLEVKSVTDGSRPLTYEDYTEGPDEVIKIGDADRTVSGAQRYVISYTVQGAMNRFADHDELFWNVDGGAWPVAKESVAANVTTPAGAWTELACYQGPTGSREGCATSAVNNFLTFSSTRRLAEGEQMSIAVKLVKGAVDVPPPLLSARAREFPQDAFDVNLLTVGVALLVAIAGIGAVAWNWWRHGRDRAYLTRYYEAPTSAPDEPEPLFKHEPVVVEFGPPQHMKPAQLGLILDEQADPKDVTASIVDLAVRGYLTITDQPGFLGSHDWLLTKKEADENALLPYERTLLNGLFEGRSEVKVSELKGKFRSTLQAVEGQVVSDAMSRRLFTANPNVARGGWGCLGVGVLLLGGVATYFLGIALGWGLVGLAVVLVGGVLVATAMNMSQRSAAGRELLLKTLGFRLYMDTAEKYRQQFAEKAEIFTQLLPYAIVFGVVSKWAKAFEGIDTSQANSSWYVGNAPFQAALLSSSLQSMNNSISSAITASPPSSGSSSAFGGGGSSGGGGGGGGGGSW